MSLSAGFTSQQIAAALAGNGATNVIQTQGMQGYEIWNRSGFTIYLIDDFGQTVDAIQPYSQRTGSILLATTTLKFTITTIDPQVNSVSYPSSTWQVLYQLSNSPLPQISTQLNTGVIVASSPLIPLATFKSLVGAGLHSINLPVPAGVTALAIEFANAGAEVSSLIIQGHQSLMTFFGPTTGSGPPPPAGVFYVALGGQDTSIDLFITLAGAGSVTYWISGIQGQSVVSNVVTTVPFSPVAASATVLCHNTGALPLGLIAYSSAAFSPLYGVISGNITAGGMIDWAPAGISLGNYMQFHMTLRGQTSTKEISIYSGVATGSPDATGKVQVLGPYSDSFQLGINMAQAFPIDTQLTLVGYIDAIAASSGVASGDAWVGGSVLYA